MKLHEAEMNRTDNERIRELEAEVARLQRGEFTASEFQNLCHNLPSSCTPEDFCGGCEEYQKKLFGNSPTALERDRLKQRIAQLEAEKRGGPVIFLDIDGVLNRIGPDHATRTKVRNPHGSIGIEPELAQRLRELILKSGAYVVISSTWRIHPDLVDHIWECVGLDLKERWAGNTPSLVGKHESGLFTAKIRGDEIAAWLKEHPEIKNFVIIDDGHDMGELVHRLVLTDIFEGLTEANVEKAINLLKQ